MNLLIVFILPLLVFGAPTRPISIEYDVGCTGCVGCKGKLLFRRIAMDCKVLEKWNCFSYQPVFGCSSRLSIGGDCRSSVACESGYCKNYKCVDESRNEQQRILIATPFGWKSVLITFFALATLLILSVAFFDCMRIHVKEANDNKV